MKDRRKSKLRRTPPEKRIRIIEQFERSGQTRRTFSQQSGVPLSTLGKWLKDSRNSRNHTTPVLFQEVALPDTHSDVSTPWAMELVGPTGILIRCRDSLTIQEAILLLYGFQ